ncbi:MAG: hypothetical protein JWP27_1685, partial [Flaviaesturariibacter sp.]|nr:hypothetical protein [Flaviaesturariibacter sp.]
MKKVVTILFVLATLLYAVPGCSQRYGIYKGSAYVRESYGGAQRVGPDGRPVKPTPIRELLVYVQTDSSATPPKIGQVWIGRVPYGVSISPAPQVPSEIGTIKGTDKQATIPVARHRITYQLALLPLVTPDPVIPDSA